MAKKSKKAFKQFDIDIRFIAIHIDDVKSRRSYLAVRKAVLADCRYEIVKVHE